MEKEKSRYSGVTGFELAEMLNEKSKYSKEEAIQFISSAEEKFKKS